ncbi:hypothetical protein Agub_g10818, partial [Astrephomene gubernaculifera]
MSTAQRPSRAAKETALNSKPWLETGGAQQAANAPQPPKQSRLTEVFPVCKGPGPAQKAQQKTVATTQLTTPKTAATERTKARAAQTAAATQSAATAATRGRKRRNPSRTGCDDDDEQNTLSSDGEEADGDAAPATTTTTLRRSTRKAVTAPKVPARTASKAATGPATAPKGGKATTTTATTAPARRRGAGGTSSSSAPRFLSSWEIDGEEYRAGDDVYVVETDDVDQLPDEEEDEECAICGRNTDPARMVECDRCLRGFHFRCLRPPLKKLPEGDWVCPDCESGVLPATSAAEGRKLNTCCQAFLFGEKILGLARVCGWMRDRQGEVQLLVRHYTKPEGTHLGRQKHHHSREVFLGVAEHLEDPGCIWGRALVVPPERFEEAPGADVYVCEYEYDDKWKRFRRRLGSDEEGQGAASDDDAEWGAAAAAAVPAAGGRRGGGKGQGSGGRGGKGRGRGGAGSSDGGSESSEVEEDRDAEYKPRNTLDGWVIRKPRPGQPLSTQTRTRSAAGRAHSYKAIIDEHGSGLLLDQGAATVPERGPVGPLAAARRALALNNRSGELPCREAEKGALRRFIGHAVEEGGDSPGVLYICGVPGTGKTACVMEVLGGVRNQAQDSGVQ